MPDEPAMTNPSISVVIPTYNQPDLLRETLDSVFAQTFGDYEVIVVNDGSTDTTAGRLEEMRATYGERLRVITTTNGGVGAARNRGIDEARGKYVATLDHDDIWLPRKLEVQFGFMEAHPECGSCVVPYAYNDRPGIPAYGVEDIAFPNGIVRRPWLVSTISAPVLMSSVLMFDRVRAVGLRYGTQRQCIEDVEFQLKLVARGAVGIASFDVLAQYRLHETNYSGQSIFYDRGIRRLRRLEREGAFDSLVGHDLDDARAYLASLGRTAAVRSLLAGKRAAGLLTFLRELPHQIRQRRLRFLAIFPVLLLAPASILRRYPRNP